MRMCARMSCTHMCTTASTPTLTSGRPCAFPYGRLNGLRHTQCPSHMCRHACVRTHMKHACACVHAPLLCSTPMHRCPHSTHVHTCTDCVAPAHTPHSECTSQRMHTSRAQLSRYAMPFHAGFQTCARTAPHALQTHP